MWVSGLGIERSVSLPLTDLDPQPSAPKAAVQRSTLAACHPAPANASGTNVLPSNASIPFGSPTSGSGGNRRKSTSLGDPGSSAWRTLSGLGKENANGELGHDNYVHAED